MTEQIGNALFWAAIIGAAVVWIWCELVPTLRREDPGPARAGSALVPDLPPVPALPEPMSSSALLPEETGPILTPPELPGDKTEPMWIATYVSGGRDAEPMRK
jgi:hypothetical protein